jgi:hypothetical protein
MAWVKWETSGWVSRVPVRDLVVITEEKSDHDE